MEFNATFIITAISFIVFVYLMNTILYSPLEHIVEEREKLISGNYSNANALNTEAKTLLENKAQEIAAAKTQAKNSIDEKLKKAYSKSTEKIRSEKENCLDAIKEQKQLLHEECEAIQNNMESDVENLSRIISEKLLNGKK